LPSFARASKRICVLFSAPFSREYVGTTMAQSLSLPSSVRSKSSEKSSSFFCEIGSVGIEGSFGGEGGGRDKAGEREETEFRGD
jgi:hypothetical protein